MLAHFWRPKHYPRILVAITLLAIALRLWGLPFGLPNLARPDENHLSKFVVHFIMQSFFEGHPTLDPQFFHYPSLYIYLSLGLYTLYYLLGHLAGAFSDGNQFIWLYLNNWSSYHLINRGLSALFGILSIPAIIGIGTVFFRSRWLGLLSGLVLAVTYLHVRDSHFGVTDTSYTFWILMSQWLALAYYSSGKIKQFYLAALFAGLAATTKYPGGLVMTSVLLSYLLHHQKHGIGWQALLSQPKTLKPIVFSLLIVFGVFFGCSPYILLDPVRFWDDFRDQVGAIASTNFVESAPGWIYHPTFSLWYGLGGALFISGVIGAMLTLRQAAQKQHPFWILSIFWILFFAVNAKTQFVFVRYAIPMIPILIMTAVWAIWTVSCQLKSKTALPISIKTLSLMITLLCSAQSIAYSLRVDQLFSVVDTRTMGRDFLLSHLKSPTDAVGVGLIFSHVDMPHTYDKYFLSPPQGEFRAGQCTPSYIYTPKATLKSKEFTDRHERGITSYADTAMLRQLGIRYFSIGLAPLCFYALPTEELKQIENNPELKLVANYLPNQQGKTLPAHTAYDQIDGFFLPFSTFEGIERPGPEIRIYEVLPKKK